MKQSQLFILIPNIFMAGSFFVDDNVGTLFMLILGFLWLIGAVICYPFERTLERLDSLKSKLQFEMILNSLSDHSNRRPRK